jgi:dolichol-phosphate mannosyltransferase
MNNKKTVLSVVSPVYMEETTINEFYSRLKKVLVDLSLQFDHEIIFVNDGSTDKSLDLILNLSKNDKTIRIVNLSRNFGHQAAITAGTDYAQGDAVVIIDSDLQDPPEIIPSMIEKWREGYKVVYGVRNKRNGESIFKVFTAKIFYRLINRLSDTTLPLDVGDFRLLDRSVVNTLKGLNEKKRYIRGMISWLGFPQYGLQYDREPRYAGKSKYTLNKMIGFALNGITSFSDKPLRLFIYLGFILTFFSMFYAIFLIVNKIIFPQSTIQGWVTLITIILFMGGVQLMSIGVLGIYIGNIYMEVKDRPLYVVEKTYNINNSIKRINEPVESNALLKC